MMRNRTFMMGLGIGIIAGGILLQLMLIGQGAALTKAGQPGEMTKEELAAAAEALDMQVVEAGDERMTAEQWEQKRLSEDAAAEPQGEDTAAEPESEDAAAEPPAEEETGKPQAPKEPDQPEGGADAAPAAAPQASSPNAPKAPTEADATITVRVPSGSYLSDVADSLLAAGVIKDKQAFIAKATEKKINRSIQSGTYTFTAGEDFHSIIGKITAKPSN